MVTKARLVRKVCQAPLDPQGLRVLQVRRVRQELMVPLAFQVLPDRLVWMARLVMRVLQDRQARTELQVLPAQPVPLVLKVQLDQRVLQARMARMASQVHRVLPELLVRQAHRARSERSLYHSTSRPLA